MNPLATLTPVTLIPTRPQRLWGYPAVANFAAGGLGAGFYVVVACVADFLPAPALTLASWLGPGLVVAGFLAVAAEAGRPFRGPRVLRRVSTSWMSRELWLGAAFVGLATGEFFVPASGLRLLAALAATGLVLAQGCLLRRARGVPAWDTPVMPAIFLTSALVSGTGLLTLAEVLTGGMPAGARLFAQMVLVVVAAVVWLVYLTWHGDEASQTATRALREGRVAAEVLIGGYLVPFALAAIGLAFPATAWIAGPLAGALMVIGQVRAKALMILDAGLLRPITVPHLRLTRRPS
jgi:DMSO reductase anchor subunit